MPAIDDMRAEALPGIIGAIISTIPIGVSQNLWALVVGVGGLLYRRT